MSLARSHRTALAAILLALANFVPARAADYTLAEARKLLLGGKYAEAIEAFQSLPGDQATAAALGLARAQESSGKRETAAKTLEAAAEKDPESPAIPAEQARLAFDRGDYESAQKYVDASLKLSENNLLARWIQSELYQFTGRLKEAGESYEWFIEYYNRTDQFTPDDLRWIGLAATQFARWQRVSDQFGFLVNTLYPDVLELDANYWPAHYEAGVIWLEKYNQAEAAKELQAALQLNPNSAEVHAAVARLALQNYNLDEAKRSLERALEINPELAEAHALMADAELANFDTAAAIELLEKARPLNPVSESTLGRLAAAYLLSDGTTENGEDTRYGKLKVEVDARNPQAGTFYYNVGATLDQARRFPDAVSYYEEAIDRMPQLIGPRASLGMLHMRLGNEDTATGLLKESFEIDPFNVRVSNTLKVLEVLEGYATLETEHFIIKYDGEKDRLLAEYAGRYLEAAYPDLCKQMGFEPPGKSLFELFSKAKNTDGHGWFSARMVGLPYIGTVGACAGQMVALASPTDLKTPYNWARVLRHEFVHVINLQQTQFNIPHWYTEALAVLNEGYPRPPDWNQLLLKRVPAGETFDLETINLGFIRPQSSDDWTMAYCQAELYAEYMLEKFGEDALAKMLSAYADNLPTRDAIQRSFGISQEEFEAGYQAHIDKVLAGLKAGPEKTERTPAELDRAYRANPNDPELLAEKAYLELQNKSYATARRFAEKARQQDPKQQLAAYVLARVRILIGETAAAQELLEETLDKESPEERTLALLAALHYSQERFDQAADLYELGSQKFPADDKWIKYLARVYLKAADNDKLTTVLARMAELDADNFLARKKLATMALEQKNFAEAQRWAVDAIQINVMDAEIHRLAAKAFAGQKKHAEQAIELAAALELQPGDAELMLSLAQAYAASEQNEKAAETAQQLLKLDPDNKQAQQLLESLKP